MVALHKFTEENGYKSGDIVWVYADGKTECNCGVIDNKEDPLLFCKESHVCVTAIENQYYVTGGNPLKGGRMGTKHGSCHCYSTWCFADDTDAESICNRHSRSYLIICKYCLNNEVPLTFRNGGKQNQVQENAEKRRKKSNAKVMHNRANKAWVFGVVGGDMIMKGFYESLN